MRALGLCQLGQVPNSGQPLSPGSHRKIRGAMEQQSRFLSYLISVHTPGNPAVAPADSPRAPLLAARNNSEHAFEGF